MVVLDKPVLWNKMQLYSASQPMRDGDANWDYLQDVQNQPHGAMEIVHQNVINVCSNLKPIKNRLHITTRHKHLTSFVNA